MDGATEIFSVNREFFLLQENGELFCGKNLALLAPVEGKFLDLWSADKVYGALRRRSKSLSDLTVATLVHFEPGNRRWVDHRLSLPVGDLVWVSPSGDAAILHGEFGDVIRVNRRGSSRLVNKTSHVAITASGDLMYWMDRDDPKRLRIRRFADSKAWTLGHTRDIVDVMAAEERVYLLDDKGGLYRVRLEKKNLRKVRGGVQFIASSGPVLIAATDLKTPLQKARAPWRLCLIKPKSSVVELPSTPVGPRDLVYDAGSGELYCYEPYEELFFYDSKRRSWEHLAVRRAVESLGE